MKLTAAIVILLLHITFDKSHSTHLVSSYDDSEVLLSKTIEGLKSALNFFSREYQNVNLDAIIGTRMVSDQLKVLLSRIESRGTTNLSGNFVHAIREVQKLAEKISNAAIPYIASSSPEYYANIGAILKDGFWTLNYPSRNLDISLVTRDRMTGEAMHETDSDNCLRELFGTGPKSTETCQISDHCWLLMTSEGYSGYSLSHQIFYLQIGKQFGCETEMLLKVLEHNKPGLDRMGEGFCANIHQEATEIAEQGFESNRRDLFMEQAALCGMMGYKQFFNSDWLEHILHWQSRNGCYVLGDDESPRPGTHFKRNRQKRDEKSFPDGCLCHRTAVAAAAQAQYIRFIIEHIESQYKH